MLISEYLQMRNISVTTGNPGQDTNISVNNTIKPQNSPFANELKSQLEKQQQNGVQFSQHAIERLNQRQIDLDENNKLDRLNKAVEVAQQKGSNDTLVLLDKTAFLVSVKNNKVITTMSAEDLQGNIFTNIDSTVIM